MQEPSYTHERNFGCRITETLYRGLPVVTLENELVRVSVLAGKGSDIFEFLHKPTDTDFMWRSPLGVRNPAQHVPSVARADGAFLDYYEGGWQECFPTGGNAIDHAGTSFGLHGEVSLMPWAYRIETDTPEQVVVKFWVRTVRTPFLVEKTLRLDRHRSVLKISERVVNEGAVPQDFVWGQHPAFGAPFLDDSCVIDLPGATVEILDLAGDSRLAAGSGLRWPHVQGRDGEAIDLSRIPTPAAKAQDLAFLTNLEAGWYALTNTSRQVGFGMVWPLDVYPVLWFWQVFGGATGSPWYGRTFNIALEPWSSPHSTLHAAQAHGTHRTLDAGAALTVEYAAVAYSGVTRVAQIHADGRVDAQTTGNTTGNTDDESEVRA
ncbi:MAG: aldose 1-epimerase [Litorilinea sp.]